MKEVRREARMDGLEPDAFSMMDLGSREGGLAGET